MKIDFGAGPSIYVTPRREGGICLHQGPSKIMLSTRELAAVLDAIDTLQGNREAVTGSANASSSSR